MEGMMRKSLGVIALLMLLLLWGVTVYAILGPHSLPERIPTHFNAAGQPDGWGTPAMLWPLPVVATVIYLLMGLVAGHPAAFNFPMRVAPGSRLQLEAIALSMISWLRAEVVCLFAWIQYQTIQLARRGAGELPALFLPVVLVVVFGTITWHIAAMRRAGWTQ
jgi:uncharacterized membrane protein